MNHELSRLREQEAQRNEAGQAARNQSEREYSSPEEMLRHDSEQNPVPPEVARRVNESIAREPKPRRWWRKLLGG